MEKTDQPPSQAASLEDQVGIPGFNVFSMLVLRWGGWGLVLLHASCFWVSVLISCSFYIYIYEWDLPFVLLYCCLVLACVCICVPMCDIHVERKFVDSENDQSQVEYTLRPAKGNLFKLLPLFLRPSNEDMPSKETCQNIVEAKSTFTLKQNRGLRTLHCVVHLNYLMSDFWCLNWKRLYCECETAVLCVLKFSILCRKSFYSCRTLLYLSSLFCVGHGQSHT